MKNLIDCETVWANLVDESKYGLPYVGPVRMYSNLSDKRYMVIIPSFNDSMAERYVVVNEEDLVAD